ncbi:MAG TPA: HD domain-containing protein, partial [Nitrosospira sp.]|nr:HD domain-containing protein [Nitrosospira sp.]
MTSHFSFPAVPFEVIGPNASVWLETLRPIFSPAELEAFGNALHFSQPFYADKLLLTGESTAQHMHGVVSILASLRVDADTLVAGILHSVPMYLDGYPEKLNPSFNPTVTHLVEGVARMGRIRTLGARNVPDRSAQVEALRKMLLAMAEDIRVVIIALADRVQTMRYIAANNVHGRAEIAHETLDLFAPLANRLGLWQVKWELEDFSFRIIEPERYKKIATLLEETRRIREDYIAMVVAKLQGELKRTRIEAEVTGRPKHIYSIH